MPHITFTLLIGAVALSLTACNGGSAEPADAAMGSASAETAAPSPTASPSPTEGAPSPDQAGAECGADKLNDYLNRLYGESVREELRAIVSHDRIRPIRPGDAVTMDFRPDRLNIDIGKDGRIKSLRCG